MNLNEPFGDEAVRLAMNFNGRLGIWRVTKTENLARFLVDPVLVIMDAIFVLHLNVFRVRFGNILGRNATRNLVNVHVVRHASL